MGRTTCTTLKTSGEVTAPFWQWPPFDAITDFLPLHDDESLHFDLKPDVTSDPQQIMDRADNLKAELESSPRTVRKNVLDVKATTKPTTEPAADQG
jgi:hypothetical protein